MHKYIKSVKYKIKDTEVTKEEVKKYLSKIYMTIQDIEKQEKKIV